jgi:hypothetical protein
MEGGCLCGTVRYSVEATSDVGYCHCRICQLSSGAPAVVWMTVPCDAFRYTAGAPQEYRSSPRGLRYFCGICGTQLCFRRPQRTSAVDVNVATLDDPGAVKPQYHIWTSSKICWFDTADDLPRYGDDGPDAEAMP